jgi:heat shock protein HtpX
MYRAQEVGPGHRLFGIVERLSRQAMLPMPKVYVIPDASPNAFATGRNPSHASVAFTAGILQLMNDRELEGVVAHELGHVLHRDILTSSIAATLAAAITHLAYMAMWFGGGRRDDEEGGSPWAGILMVFLAPIAAGLIQMAISRSREYDADAAAAKHTGSPDGLINGLRKLEMGVERVPMPDASPATAHMFILNPFRNGGITRLFSTHPSTEDRIARLEAMRGDAFRLSPARAH